MKKTKRPNFRYRLFKFVDMLGAWAYKGADYECARDPGKEEYTYNPAFLSIFRLLTKIQDRIAGNEIINRYYKESGRLVKVIKTKEEPAKYYEEHGEDRTFQVNVARLIFKTCKRK